MKKSIIGRELKKILFMLSLMGVFLFILLSVDPHDISKVISYMITAIFIGIVIYFIFIIFKNYIIFFGELSVKIDENQIVHITYDTYQWDISNHELQSMKVLPKNDTDLSHIQRKIICQYIHNKFPSIVKLDGYKLINDWDLPSYFQDFIPATTKQKKKYSRVLFTPNITKYIIMLLILVGCIFLTFRSDLWTAEAKTFQIPFILFFGFDFIAFFLYFSSKSKNEIEEQDSLQMYCREFEIFDKYYTVENIRYGKGSSEQYFYFIRLFDREKKVCLYPIQVNSRVYRRKQKTCLLYMFLNSNGEVEKTDII